MKTVLRKFCSLIVRGCFLICSILLFAVSVMTETSSSSNGLPWGYPIHGDRLNLQDRGRVLQVCWSRRLDRNLQTARRSTAVDGSDNDTYSSHTPFTPSLSLLLAQQKGQTKKKRAESGVHISPAWEPTNSEVRCIRASVSSSFSSKSRQGSTDRCPISRSLGFTILLQVETTTFPLEVPHVSERPLSTVRWCAVVKSRRAVSTRNAALSKFHWPADDVASRGCRADSYSQRAPRSQGASRGVAQRRLAGSVLSFRLSTRNHTPRKLRKTTYPLSPPRRSSHAYFSCVVNFLATGLVNKARAKDTGGEPDEG